MVFDTLGPALQRAIVRGSFDAALMHHGEGLSQPADVPDLPDLLKQLDETAPYSPERDALLGDLFRLHRRCRNGAALSALLYALHAGVVRRCRRLSVMRSDPHEGAAEILHALVECLDAYEPDRPGRSPYIQASIEWAVRDRLRSARRNDRRREDAHVAVADLAENAASDLDAGVHMLADLIEPCQDGPTEEFDAEDQEAARALLGRLVEHRLLHPRDAELLLRVFVHGQRITEAAPTLGMTPEAARQVLRRVRQNLGKRRGEVESLFPSRFSTGVPSTE